MLRLSANISTMFTEWPMIDRFAAAADSGFAAVEIQFPYAIAAAELDRARSAAGVDLVLINMPPGDLAAGDLGLACIPGRRDDFGRALERALAYCRTLGCPSLNGLSGKAISSRRAEAFETMRANMLDAADACARQGVLLLTEALNRVEQPDFLINDLAMADALLDAVAHPNLKLQYDAYHARANGDDPIAAMAQRIKRIGHVQVSDHPGRREPGAGDIDFAALFRYLDGAAYAGWIGCEYTPVADTLSGLGWIESHGLRAAETEV